MHMELRDAIRAAIDGLSHSEVASRLGVSQPTVSRWASGETEPRFAEILRLERACGRPAGFILAAVADIQVTTVPDAIAMDPVLTDQGRRVLLATYDALVVEAKANADGSGHSH